MGVVKCELRGVARDGDGNRGRLRRSAAAGCDYFVLLTSVTSESGICNWPIP